MEIMVTLPEDAVEREALFQRAAQLHAEAICAALEGLRCAEEQKTALLQGLIRANRAGNDAETYQS